MSRVPYAVVKSSPRRIVMQPSKTQSSEHVRVGIRPGLGFPCLTRGEQIGGARSAMVAMKFVGKLV